MSWDSTLNAFIPPSPRAEPLRYAEYVWPIEASRSLPTPSNTHSWAEILAARESRRTFGPLSEALLSEFLWHLAACKRSADSPMGFPIERRGVPSAGAIHPIHVLVGDPRSGRLDRYDGRSHALERLAISIPQALLNASTNLMSPQEGALLLFAAEPGKTAAKYEHSGSLVWRDAGVLQGGCALVAEAMGLNFCLLGMTGEPWVSSLSEKGELCGVGIALVGSRP